jgi:hypothetical protein
MKTKDIIRLANKAEMIIDYESNPWGPVITATCADLERFATLVAEAEREACCSVVYGQCGSDNVAQRTVDAIRGRK